MSLQPLKFIEEKKDVYDKIKQKYENNIVEQTNGFHPSYYVSTQGTHVSSDDHDITNSSINKLNEKQIQLHSTIPKINEQIIEENIQSIASKIEIPTQIIVTKEELTLRSKNEKSNPSIENDRQSSMVGLLNEINRSFISKTKSIEKSYNLIQTE